MGSRPALRAEKSDHARLPDARITRRVVEREGKVALKLPAAADPSRATRRLAVRSRSAPPVPRATRAERRRYSARHIPVKARQGPDRDPLRAGVRPVAPS